MKNREILFIVRMRNEARAALKGLGSDLKSASNAARSAADDIRKVNTATDGSATSFKRGTNAALSFALGMRRVVNILGAVGVGLSIGAAIGETITATKDFETSLSRIVGLVGIAEDTVKGFGDEVLKLGGDVSKSPVELADALFFITSAGLRGQNALDALTASAKASAGGLGDTKTVADAVTSALNAYATSNLKASQVTDILTATVREGKLEATGLARSIGQVLPVAENAGVQLHEVGATIAALTQVGLPATSAIAGLRGVLVALNRQSEEAKPILKLVGTSFAEIKQNIKDRGLLAALKDLRDRLGDNDAALTKVFGDVEAVNTVLALTGGNAEKVTGIFERMKNTTGATDVAFDAAAKTVEFKFNTAVANLQTAMINLGSKALPDLADGLLFLSENLDGIAKVAAVVGLLFSGRLIAGARGYAAALFGLGAAATGTARAMQLLAAAAKLVKIALIFTAIDKGAELFQKFNEEVAEGVTTWSLFGAAGKGVLDVLIAAAKNYLGIWRGIFSAVLDFVSGDIAGAKEEIGKAWESAGKIAGLSFKDAIEANLKDLAVGAQLRKQLAAQRDIDFFGELNLSGSAAKAGAAAGKVAGNAFLSALQASGQQLAAFQSSLGQIAQKFAPEIGRTKELNDALGILAIAAKATDAQLKTLGFTKAQLAEITDRVKEAQKAETSEVGKAIEAAQRRIEVAKLDNNERAIEAKVLEVVAAAKAKNQKVTAEEIKQLRERLTLAQQSEARKALGDSLKDTIRGLQQQRELLGASEQQRRRIVAVEELKNRAQKAGVADISKELDLLNRQFDLLDAAENKFKGDAFGGARAGLRKFIDEAQDLRGQFEDFTTSTLSNLSDAITQFAETGKFSIKDFVNSALADLQKIASKGIVADLAGAFGFTGSNGQAGGGGSGGALSSGIGQLGGLVSSFFQSGGGVVGRDGRRGFLPAAMFADAQRFQNGGTVRRGTDSVPILATPGEVVLTEHQADFLRRALEGRSVGGLHPDQNVQQDSRSAPDARGISNTVTVVMNITTPDPGAFRRSQDQIGAATAGSINRALRRNG